MFKYRTRQQLRWQAYKTNANLLGLLTEILLTNFVETKLVLSYYKFIIVIYILGGLHNFESNVNVRQARAFLPYGSGLLCRYSLFIETGFSLARGPHSAMRWPTPRPFPLMGLPCHLLINNSLSPIIKGIFSSRA